MKWILAIVLGLIVTVSAEARPHLNGKVRGWLHKRNHPVRVHRNWGVKTVKPPCDCCKPECKCKPKCNCK